MKYCQHSLLLIIQTHIVHFAIIYSLFLHFPCTAYKFDNFKFKHLPNIDFYRRYKFIAQAQQQYILVTTQTYLIIQVKLSIWQLAAPKRLFFFECFFLQPYNPTTKNIYVNHLLYVSISFT